MPCRLLISIKDDHLKSRSWRHFKDAQEMAKEVIEYFEDYLQTVKSMDEKAYISDELFEFLETFFEEIVCLVEDNETPDLWIPLGLSYLKQVIYEYFRTLFEKNRKTDLVQDLEEKPQQVGLFSAPSAVLDGDDRVKDKIDELIEIVQADNISYGQNQSSVMDDDFDMDQEELIY